MGDIKLKKKKLKIHLVSVLTLTILFYFLLILNLNKIVIEKIHLSVVLMINLFVLFSIFIWLKNIEVEKKQRVYILSILGIGAILILISCRYLIFPNLFPNLLNIHITEYFIINSSIEFNFPKIEFFILDIINFLIISLFLVFIWTIVIPFKEEKHEPKKTYKSKEIEKVSEYYRHVDNLIHQRFNFFMLAESMLIISFVYTLQLENFEVIRFAIGVLGISFSVGWLYTNARLFGRLSYMIEEYLKKDDLVFFNQLVKSVRGLYAGSVLTYYLPIVTIMFWIFITSYYLVDSVSNINWIRIVLFSFLLVILFSYYIKRHIVFFKNNNND